MSTEKQDRLMGFTTFFVVVLTVVSMTIMLRYAAHKTIVVAEEVTAGSGAEQEYARKKEVSFPLLLQENRGIAPSVRIPLSDHVRPDDIVIENHYLEHRINVIIQGAKASDYKEQPIQGSIEQIQAAACYEEADSVVLAFQMNGLYEHKYLLEENALYLDFVNPHEMYEKIVVLDAGHGGRDVGAKVRMLQEKELTLAVVKKAMEQLAESDVRVYCTRQQDETVPLDERVTFINELRPDFVVSVHFNHDEEAERYGTEVWYHSAFVVPVFGNPEIGDAIERNVVQAVDGRANGLFDCTEQREGSPETLFLTRLHVPAIVLEGGYLTNSRERQLLEQPDYVDRMAEGVSLGVQEAEERLAELSTE